MSDGFPAEQEPDGDVLLPHHAYIGLGLAAFGFTFVWPAYPAAGAVLSLLGLFVLGDDLVSHAFGVWTPLDWLFKRFIVGWLR